MSQIHTKEEMIGILTLAIYSREIFPSNAEVSKFIKHVFLIEYLPYVINSRTLLCARLMRVISSYDETQIMKTNKNIKFYFNHPDSAFFNSLILKNNKNKLKSNANSDVSKWISGLLGKKK